MTGGWCSPSWPCRERWTLGSANDPGLTSGRHQDSAERALDNSRPRGAPGASSLRLSAAAGRRQSRSIRATIEVVLVPGLMFARDGGRLGHGKGYYDTLLSSFQPRPYLIGVTVDRRVVDDLAHDRPRRLDGRGCNRNRVSTRSGFGIEREQSARRIHLAGSELPRRWSSRS